MYGIEFMDPAFLLLMIPLAAAALWYFITVRRRHDGALAVSSAMLLERRRSFRTRTYRYLPVLRILAVFFLILALARPGHGIRYESIRQMGIDIMIALDVSDSMMGEDFQPRNRLEVAKQVVRDFVERRVSDRVGMVIFSGEAYLQCPLTADHGIIGDILGEIDFDSVEEEGTAIGEALALAASRMMESKAKSRVILLITDGMNNRGSVDPETAARMCAGIGIKVYTVGIGKEGKVPYPDRGGIFGFKRYLYNHFDEESIRAISDLTGGKFYRASSSGVLWDAVKDIDRLEKSEIRSSAYHRFSDRFQEMLLFSMVFFFLEVLLRSMVYRKIP